MKKSSLFFLVFALVSIATLSAKPYAAITGSYVSAGCTILEISIYEDHNDRDASNDTFITSTLVKLCDNKKVSDSDNENLGQFIHENGKVYYKDPQGIIHECNTKLPDSQKIQFFEKVE